jgi:coproporphyrinogen III oxidase
LYNENKFYQYIQNLQDQIVAGLEAVEGQAKFKEDFGTSEGGGGRTRKRKCFRKKGGVNISAVHGKNCETMQKMLWVKLIFLPAD